MTEKALGKKLHELWLSAPIGSDVFAIMAKFVKKEIQKEKRKSYQNGRHHSNI